MVNIQRKQNGLPTNSSRPLCGDRVTPLPSGTYRDGHCVWTGTPLYHQECTQMDTEGHRVWAGTPLRHQECTEMDTVCGQGHPSAIRNVHGHWRCPPQLRILDPKSNNQSCISSWPSPRFRTPTGWGVSGYGANFQEESLMRKSKSTTKISEKFRIFGLKI